MNFKEAKNKIKKSWNWVWHSDSIWSWVVALIIIYIFIKLIFFPGLSLITGSSLPLAGVESSSMDHQIVEDDKGLFELCGKKYLRQKRETINSLDEYWEICGDWYEKEGITQNDFSNFPLRNGFKKGDIIFVWGRFTPKIGDIIIFEANPESKAPRPIIHRIVDINKQGIIQTKGDHNAEQLTQTNNIYKTDETNITPEQVIGKAVFKIPYLGWPKIWATEMINSFR
jgi:signal peptidase I